ncbi:24343_t:CDS:2 [Cetraspora pellucida]|uniref:24343_t:CDS:1 n=1 Tax=Cetraspora pellucida TaxID=1433469 RepID=A0A9N8ZA60_9GLOM|nr:24343_t:CDS:2 [Cetraspora pellucida]
MQSKDNELETQVSDSLLRELNSRLVTKIDKLRREKNLLISKNTKLLARINNQQKLRNRIVKLEQNQCIDTNTKLLDDKTNSNDTSEQIISYNKKSNSDIYQDLVTPTSLTETILFDSQSDLRRLKEKNVSISEAEKLLLNKDLNIQDTKLSSSESKSSIISSFNQKQSAISSETKTLYSQKVEKGLICELSIFINEKSLSNPISDRQILENMLDKDDSTPGSALHLASLFDKAKKTGQKEILCWYCYSKEFKKKVINISFKNEFNDQIVRTQIYNKMELFLSGIKREYLHKKT